MAKEKAEIINKITAKTIKVDLKPALESEISLYRIVGRATKVTRGTGNFGDWEKLDGTFEAFVFATGKSYVSNSAFLPSVVNGLIAAQLTGDNVVEFAYEVGARPQGTDGLSYEYTVKSLIDNKESSPLDELKAVTDFYNDTPALEAPKKSSKK